jgi:hypothetical protein
VSPRRALELLSGRYAVCRLGAGDALPPWAAAPGAPLLSITRTPEELSIVCEESRVPAEFPRAERGWRVARIRGRIPFDEVGVVAGVTAPLAAAGIPVFVVSTFDTDYLLVPEPRLEAARAALEAARYELAASPGR